MSGRSKRQATALRKKQQQRQMMIVGGSIIGAIILAAAVIYLVRPKDAPMPDGVKDKYAGIPQSVDGDGVGHLGNPDAPNVVREFSSFMCPHCKDLHENVIDGVVDMVKAGDVRIEFVPISQIGGPGSEEGAKAAICAGKQNKFWEMHDILFYWQGRVSTTKSRIDTAVKELGLDKGKFNDCYNDGDTRRQAERGYSEMSQYSDGTPTVLLNNELQQNPYNLVATLNQLLSTGQ
ncbi:MAG: thioredoxin domain-containing protein [Chloroflexi bacterium]|nr:thioredoxin domain-containing protein [Chloroflexota bacterium]